MMLFLTRFILASFFASLILLSTTVRSATLPQQSSKSNSIANRAAAQEGIQSGDQPTIILSATITSITPTSSSSAISNTQNSQETNENRYPDPQNGLLGPCVRNQCCCTAQVTDRSQCWNDLTTPCPGTMGRRRRGEGTKDN